MRVGYLTYGLDRAPTGIGRYAIELLQALADLPNAPEITLLTTEQEDPHGLWGHFERHALPGCRLLPALMTWGSLVLNPVAQHLQLDVIHDPNGIAPFVGAKAQARRIVTIHDAFAYVHPEEQNALDNWRYRWHLPHAARLADAVVTVSETSRRDLIAYLGLSEERVRVIHEGVNPQFRLVPDSRERREVLARYGLQSPYLLYVGGINARKNIARLFEAFARVRDRRPKLKLVIAGKRQWKTSEIDTTLQRLQLEPHIHFTGYVDDADLPALYSAAQLLVFPSLYEGFGLPPLEAMACGTPVVTSNTSSLVEVAGDAALTVDPYDVEGIADAIERVLTDETLRTDLQRRGRAHAAQFRWSHAAQATLALYEETLRSDAARVSLYSGTRLDRPYER